MNERRINSVIEAMKAQDIPQILITDSYAIDYLTGEMIQPGERFLALLLKTDGTVRLFLNRLFAADKIPQELIVFYSDEVRGAVMAAQYTDSNKPLGVDKKMAAEFLLELQAQHAGSSYVNASVLVDSVRAKKDEEEQKLMEIASQINDRSMLQIKNMVKEGITEKELSDELLELPPPHAAMDSAIVPASKSAIAFLNFICFSSLFQDNSFFSQCFNVRFRQFR